jgi:hypothetical protein
MSTNGKRLEQYAELAVRVGANVQPGQEVFIQPMVEHTDLARALVRQAYEAGASYVHVIYRDEHVRRARIELGPDSALTYSPEWEIKLTESEAGNASIGTTGKPDPQLLADLDGERIGRAIQAQIAEINQRQHRENTVNWCGIGAPNEGWARQVFGEPDVERLWEKVAFCMRLDEPDPVAAWREHLARLETRAEALTAHRPHGRPAAEREVGERPLPHLRRDRLRREHADRGDLHDAGLPPCRGDDPLEQAAVAQRADHPRPRAHLRGRAGRRCRRRAGRGSRPQPDRDERECRPAR